MAESRFRNAAKGILAIIIWLALYAFVWWYWTVGWLGYLIVAAPIAAILWIASRVSKRAREFLTKQVGDAVGWVFGIYEEKMDWIGYFVLVLMYGGVLYFVLFAPDGVLCRFGVRACGQR